MTANLQWTKLLGTPQEDYGASVVATMSGSVYVAGVTFGDLQGNTSNGSSDAFLTKLDDTGSPVWTILIGSKNGDISYSISEADNGDIFLAGSIGGEISNQPLTGTYDAFVIRLDSEGNTLWTQQYGLGNQDYATGIAASFDGAYVTGFSETTGSSREDYDGFIYKIDNTGIVKWSNVVVSSGDVYPQDIAVANDGSIYITGYASGELDANSSTPSNPGDEAIFSTFIIKLNSDGSRDWTRFVGSSSSVQGFDLATDRDSAVYVTGAISGNLDNESSNGGSDAFVVKYDSLGNRIWTRLIGTSQRDWAQSVVSDKNGSIYIAGTTTGIFPGQLISEEMGAGERAGDIFLAKLGTDGTLRGTLQYGTENLDEAYSVATSGNGAIYVSGGTYGNLGGQQNASLAAERLDADAFIIRHDDPELSNVTNTESSSSSSSQSSTSTPVTTATPATTGVDPISQSQPSISPPPSFPPSSSPILGIEPQETVKTVALQTPLAIGSLQINQVVIGTAARDVITGSNTGEALSGAQGKDKMTGGGGSDAFVFETPGEFGKKKADTITDFRPEEGDKIAIAKETFGDLSRITMDTVTGKQEAKTAASTNKNLIYDDKSGMLYFNENGSKAGFGNGGEFAKLLGVPEISKGDLVLL